jgi:hypothetical protein
MSALADPWVLFAVAIVSAVALGLAAGGAPAAAAIAAASGALLLVILVGLTLVVTSVMHLVVRDRRRGELVALFFILTLPILGLLPQLAAGQERSNRDNERQPHERRPSAFWTAVERNGPRVVPSELYVAATRAAAQSDLAPASRSVLALAAGAGLLHAVAFVVFVRLLDSPGTIGAGRARSTSQPDPWRVPGLSSATSAVALNQLRLGLRTPRGRSTLLSPIVVFVMFAVMMVRSRSGMDFGPVRLETGLGLAAFTSFVSLLAILPLAMNQFAVDRAGLTLALLAPLDARALLRGKAIGNGLVAAIPSVVCMIGAALLFPTGDAALWVSMPLGLLAAYLLVAPAAAVLSAVFPRAVDLNRIGRGSNAHGAAGLLGTLSFAASVAPCVFLVVLARSILGRPGLAPVFLLVWLALCAGASAVLFRAAVAIFEKRRENLGFVAHGKPT